MAKVITAKADLPSTVAALMAFAQSAAAAVGVLAVARTPDGLLNVPNAELVLVCLGTLVVAVALAVGCLRLLAGRSSRLTIVGSAASLGISAYWIFLRPPAETFPDIAVAYAVLPVLILGSLALSRALTARRTKVPTQAAARKADSPEPNAESPTSQTQRPWELADEPAQDDSTPEDYEPAHEEIEGPWEAAEQRLGLLSEPAALSDTQPATLAREAEEDDIRAHSQA